MSAFGAGEALVAVGAGQPGSEDVELIARPGEGGGYFDGET